MSRLLTITATDQTRVGVRKRTLSGLGLAIGPVTMPFILIVAGTLLGVFYLIQSNRVSTQNLELKAIEAKKAQIVEENERLSTEAARLQSIQLIKKAADEQKLKESGRADAYAG